MTTSRRAQNLVGEVPPLIRAHVACAAEPYHPRERPDGYVNFGTAENHLMWDLLAERLRGPRTLDEADTHYADMFGTPALRSALARHLQRRTPRAIDPEALVVSAGASALLDALAHVLFEPETAVLVPAPYYAGFDADLQARAQVRLLPVPTRAADGFALRLETLQRTLDDARAAGTRVGGLLLTQPHNPLGTSYRADLLDACLDFAGAHGLQCIVDELYAHSGHRPDYRAASALHRTEPFVHVLWGFAKDFALSGLKVAVLHTHDPEVRAAMRALSLFCPCATDTQACLAEMLRDAPFVEGFMRTNAARLAAAKAELTATLAPLGAQVLPAEAGLFAWVDLRAWLTEPTFTAEWALHERLLQEARVNVTPGQIFHHDEPGFFRLCFAQRHLSEGLRRMQAASGAQRPAATGAARRF